MKISKNEKALLEFLGPDYTMKMIDGAESVYRKINESYDIEIVGTTRKGQKMSVFVWDISRGGGITSQIVERYFDIKEWDELKTLLDQMVEKYSD